MNIPMNRSRTLLALGLAVALASTAAVAQQAAAPAAPARMHARLDANGDGMIDKSEAAKSPRLAQQFDQLDKNHDGRLAADERPQWHRDGERGGMHARMMQLDSDHDGRISSKEAAADPEMAQRFARMDDNHDGFLDRSDFQAHMRQKRDACFARADADKDGQISRAEFDATQKECRSHGGMRGPRAGDRPSMPSPPPPPAG